MLVPVKVYGNWSSNIRKWYPHICGLGLAVNIRQKKKQTHFLSFIMAAETNPRVDPATLLQLHIIRKLDEVILMLSESRTQHDSVDYVFFLMEPLISISMREDFINLMEKGVLDLLINPTGGRISKIL